MRRGIASKLSRDQYSHFSHLVIPIIEGDTTNTMGTFQDKKNKSLGVVVVVASLMAEQGGVK